MLVVVCSEHDDAVQRLVATWPAGEALRLTANDLSTSGWQIHVPDDGSATAVLSGRRIQVKDITAVLVRCPAVYSSDLPHIAAQERDFVAAEMTAFLAAWLMGLRCRVMNRPTATCLCGPPWRRLQWVQVARKLGIPVESMRWTATPAGGRSETPCVPSVSVTVVGDYCIGDVDDELRQRTRRLSDAAGVTLLTAHFSGPRAADRLLAASVLPDLQDPTIVEVLHRYLCRERVGATP
jgi:hypothetical protein